MSLEREISTWNAKDMDTILSIYSRYKDQNNFIDNLIGFLKMKPPQRGASWLLKKYVSDGGRLSEQQTNLLLSRMSEFDHWETKLHFLQCLPTLIIPTKFKETVYRFLMEGTQSEINFVRAWSYGGLIEFSEQYTEYRDSVLNVLKTALQNESASVKARVRQASKKYEYWRESFS